MDCSSTMVLASLVQNVDTANQMLAADLGCRILVANTFWTKKNFYRAVNISARLWFCVELNGVWGVELER